MPQCPICKAAVWVGQQYCTTCTNPLPQKPEEEDFFCPQCGIRMATAQDTCQRCKVSMPEIALISATAPARVWRLPLKIPGILMGAGLIIAGLLLVFPGKKIPAPPQMLMTPASQAVLEQTPGAALIPAKDTAPATSAVAAVQEISVPPAPVTSSPPVVTTSTSPPPRYFVNTPELSVRDDPDTSASLIGTLNFKDEVELLETSGGWGKLRDVRRNIVGWSYMRYLQRLAVSEQTSATPPISASEKAPSTSAVAAVQKLAVPSAPAASSPPAVTTTTTSLPRYFVNTHELSVRDGPDSSAALITTLNFKNEVELLDTSGGWGRVRDMRRNIVGWANMRYLQPLAADGPREVSPHRPSDSKEPESIASKKFEDM